jgi:hypothetical protein
MDSGCAAGVMSCHFESNEVGIRLKGEVTAQITKNAFVRNKLYGLHVANGNHVSVSTLANMFTLNVKAGVRVEGDNTFIALVKNSFEQERIGVWHTEYSRCELTSNSFTTCTDGIVITETACPKIRENKFVGNACGIRASGVLDSESIIMRNTFEGHTDVAICTELLCDIMISMNLFSENTGNAAVLTRRNACVVLNKNVFKANSVGVLIVDESNPFLDSNYYVRNDIGLHVTNLGHGIVSGNLFSNNNQTDICISRKGDPKIFHNTFDHSPVNIRCIQSGLGEIYENKFKGGHKATGVIVETDSNAVVRANLFYEMNIAIQCSDAGKGKYIANQMLHSETCGYYCGSGGTGEFHNNCVSQSKNAAVIVVENSAGSVKCNRLNSGFAGKACVHVKVRSQTEISFNLISHGPIGIHWDSDATSHVHSNAIMKCRTGVVLHGGSLGWLEKNDIMENDVGIQVQSGAATKISSNFVCSNHLMALIVHESWCEIEGNTFSSTSDLAVESYVPTFIPQKANKVRHRFVSNEKRIIPEVPSVNDEVHHFKQVAPSDFSVCEALGEHVGCQSISTQVEIIRGNPSQQSCTVPKKRTSVVATTITRTKSTTKAHVVPVIARERNVSVSGESHTPPKRLSTKSLRRVSTKAKISKKSSVVSIVSDDSFDSPILGVTPAECCLHSTPSEASPSMGHLDLSTLELSESKSILVSEFPIGTVPRTTSDLMIRNESPRSTILVDDVEIDSTPKQNFFRLDDESEKGSTCVQQLDVLERSNSNSEPLVDLSNVFSLDDNIFNDPPERRIVPSQPLLPQLVQRPNGGFAQTLRLQVKAKYPPPSPPKTTSRSCHGEELTYSEWFSASTCVKFQNSSSPPTQRAQTNEGRSRQQPPTSPNVGPNRAFYKVPMNVPGLLLQGVSISSYFSSLRPQRPTAKRNS